LACRTISFHFFLSLTFLNILRSQTCKSVQYFLSYGGFKFRPSFSMTLCMIQSLSNSVRWHARYNCNSTEGTTAELTAQMLV
jgi:hypothetical protein